MTRAVTAVTIRAITMRANATGPITAAAQEGHKSWSRTT